MRAVPFPPPCPGPFDCVVRDLADVVCSAAGIIGVLTAILLWFACWRFKLGRVWTVVATLLAVLVGMASYSAIQQYDNLKEQYEDLRASEEQRQEEIRREEFQRMTVNGGLLQLEYKITALQESVQRVQDRNNEISRRLPKPRKNFPNPK